MTLREYYFTRVQAMGYAIIISFRQLWRAAFAPSI